MVAGQEFCGEDWLKLKKRYKLLDEEDLLRYCFSSAYIVALLHDSLGIGLEDQRYVGYLVHITCKYIFRECNELMFLTA